MEKLDLISIAQKFSDDDKARKLLEKLRWPDGPVCPKCGSENDHYALKPRKDSKRPVRRGVYKCKDCRAQFTVTVGTIFHRSHIPLHKWLLAIYMMCSSKKGVSAHQLHRNLGITYKSAWFMCHRIREAMKQGPLAGKLSGIIEADETYVGGRRPGKRGRGAAGKTPVVALVERGGDVRSRVIERLTSENLKAYITENVERVSKLMTDEFSGYMQVGQVYEHHKIRHGIKEYVRGEVHTNTAEGYFSLLKRGVNGIFHHVSKHHLQRYLAEFDFRYNARKLSDTERTIMAILGVGGKRLLYRDSSVGCQ